MNNIEYGILEKLRTEIAEIRVRRHGFILRKLTFITGLLSAGSLAFSASVNLTPLLLIIPFVAIGFDVHLLSEDYRSKRIAVFLKNNNLISSDERAWEEFCQETSNNYTSFALWLPTLLVIVVTFMIYFSNPDMVREIMNVNFLYASIAVLVVVEMLLIVNHKNFRKQLEKYFAVQASAIVSPCTDDVKASNQSGVTADLNE